MTDSPRERFMTGPGVIAALDHNPDVAAGALERYGVSAGAYTTTDEMMCLVEAFQQRVVTSPAFDGDRVLGVILYERSLGITIEGLPIARYLWERKGIVSLLTVGVPLRVEPGAEFMEPIAGLDESLELAKRHRVVGTKSRNVIHRADTEVIRRIVNQQFEVARRVMAHGLIPIMEPEASLSMDDAERAQAEQILFQAILEGLGALGADDRVAFKLTIPVQPGLYSGLFADPHVVRVVALSGGFNQQRACEELQKNPGMGSSFSRAFLEGLQADMDDSTFNTTLDSSITRIAAASA
ncbi:hypothetical protein [Actinomyces ruminis]|uniref:Class I fructose-bisphosphate aldolase n=1 Tax=Actinomyces ruminis TaxID=1937003 RepID=A0ABX4MEC2_9ACTO|nr:hypothetical protein [Actinomyces ruminis]PHP53493.1 class I fructose-bisphosphate aldolase [Actinomyces ruminis]